MKKFPMIDHIPELLSKRFAGNIIWFHGHFRHRCSLHIALVAENFSRKPQAVGALRSQAVNAQCRVGKKCKRVTPSQWNAWLWPSLYKSLSAFGRPTSRQWFVLIAGPKKAETFPQREEAAYSFRNKRSSKKRYERHSSADGVGLHKSPHTDPTQE